MIFTLNHFYRPVIFPYAGNPNHFRTTFVSYSTTDLSDLKFQKRTSPEKIEFLGGITSVQVAYCTTKMRQ